MKIAAAACPALLVFLVLSGPDAAGAASPGSAERFGQVKAWTGIFRVRVSESRRIESHPPGGTEISGLNRNRMSPSCTTWSAGIVSNVTLTSVASGCGRGPKT